MPPTCPFRGVFHLIFIFLIPLTAHLESLQDKKLFDLKGKYLKRAKILENKLLNDI